MATGKMTTDETALWIAAASATMGSLGASHESRVAAERAAQAADAIVAEYRQRNSPPPATTQAFRTVG